jgi:hypothetical protein
MRAALALLVLVAGLAGAVPAAAQAYASQTVDRYFRLEWQVTRGAPGPAIDVTDRAAGPRSEHEPLLEGPCPLAGHL